MRLNLIDSLLKFISVLTHNQVMISSLRASRRTYWMHARCTDILCIFTFISVITFVLILFVFHLAHDVTRYICYVVSTGVLHFFDQVHKAHIFLLCFQTWQPFGGGMSRCHLCTMYTIYCYCLLFVLAVLSRCIYYLNCCVCCYTKPISLCESCRSRLYMRSPHY